MKNISVVLLMIVLAFSLAGCNLFNASIAGEWNWDVYETPDDPSDDFLWEFTEDGKIVLSDPQSGETTELGLYTDNGDGTIQVDLQDGSGVFTLTYEIEGSTLTLEDPAEPGNPVVLTR